MCSNFQITVLLPYNTNGERKDIYLSRDHCCILIFFFRVNKDVGEPTVCVTSLLIAI